jgi:lysozyme family protein
MALWSGVMADINISIAKTLVREGGYVNNPNDSGGATKYGVTQRDITGLPGFPADVKDLTEAQATDYYELHYWAKFGGAGHFAQVNFPMIEAQPVLDKVFDMAVLFGVSEAVSLIEGILQLVEDGLFGPHDLVALNEAEPISLVQAYKTVLAAHAVGIANAQPKDRVFLTGWLRRINS